MSNIYVHPTMTSSPGLIQVLQQRLGMFALIQGTRVRLVNPSRPTDRPTPQPSTKTGGRPRLDIVRGRP